MTKMIMSKMIMAKMKMINLDLSITGVKKTAKFLNFFFQLRLVLAALLPTHLSLHCTYIGKLYTRL